MKAVREKSIVCTVSSEVLGILVLFFSYIFVSLPCARLFLSALERTLIHPIVLHHIVFICLSVCLSVTIRFCTIAKRRITQTVPYDSPGSLVLCCQRSRRNSNGIITVCAKNVRRCGRLNRLFSTNISVHLRNCERQGHSCNGNSYGL